jgi:saccharopine dehydrogenase-like NADP-dependent oxidoreductase
MHHAFLRLIVVPLIVIQSLDAFPLLSYTTSIKKCRRGNSASGIGAPIAFRFARRVICFQNRQQNPEEIRDFSAAKGRSIASSSISLHSIQNKRILVVGGSGRVGGSVVVELLKHGASEVMIGGTSKENFIQAQRRWMKSCQEEGNSFYNTLSHSIVANRTGFVKLHREDASSVRQALQLHVTDKNKPFYDLVVHTAGPFQGKQSSTNGVLQACMQSHVPYIDVCDDYSTSCAAKENYKTMALNHSVPCIVSTGCWPGVSSLMAVQLLRYVSTNHPPKDLALNFSFFTAGSGGAGSTLLVATFLILAEQALLIQNGKRTYVPPMREYSSVDFGPIVGRKDVAHLNLLETASIHDVLGIGNIVTKFGTAPGYWNFLLGLMARLPPGWLSNEVWMEKLALFSLPIVRLVDYFAGATNAMRVDITTRNPNTTTDDLSVVSAVYAHENLERCVGECVVAFGAAILSGSVRPGIWFPEEALTQDEDITTVLQLASVGAHTVEAYGPNHTSLSTVAFWGERI